MDMKLLVIQNSVVLGNKNATLNNIEKLLENYKGHKFDLIVLPEVFSIGWVCNNFYKESESIESSQTLNFLKDIAQEYKSTVIGGSFIQKFSDGSLKNTCPVLSKTGKLVATYDKLHLFSHKGSEENKYITAGDELKLLNLENTKIGISICYDIRFPEIYRTYSRSGAEVLVNVAAWSKTKPEHWNIMHKARAIENQCYMIVADQTGKIANNEYNLGHSMIIDPWGNIEATLQEEEACLTCTIDLSKVRKLRESFPLIADRKDQDFRTFKLKEIKIDE